MMAGTLKLNFIQKISESIIDFDTFAHQKLGSFFDVLPGEDKKVSGFLFLCIVDLLLAWADMQLGWAATLRPLFVLPIILAAVYLSRKYAYALALLSALLRVESFRVSNVPPSEPFSFLINLLPALFALIVVAEFASLATDTIRELLGYIDALHEELALERIASMDLPGAADDESDGDGGGV
jgi:hypothetical protein